MADTNLIPYYQFLNFTNVEKYRKHFLDPETFPVILFGDKKVYYRDDVIASFVFILPSVSVGATSLLGKKLFIQLFNNTSDHAFPGSEPVSFFIESQKLHFLVNLEYPGIHTGDFSLHAWWGEEDNPHNFMNNKVRYDFQRISTTHESIDIPEDGIKLIAPDLPHELIRYSGSWPVTTGVPLPYNLIAETSGLEVFEKHGTTIEAIPSQIVAVAYWNLGTKFTKPGIKWIHVHFLVQYDAGIPREYFLKYKERHPAFPASSYLKIKETDELITVSNNLLKIEISKINDPTWKGISKSFYDNSGLGVFTSANLVTNNQSGPFIKNIFDGDTNEIRYESMVKEIYIEDESIPNIPARLLFSPSTSFPENIPSREDILSTNEYKRLNPLTFNRLDYSKYVLDKSDVDRPGDESFLAQDAAIEYSNRIIKSDLLRHKIKITIVAKGQYEHNGDLLCKFVSRFTVYTNDPAVHINHRTILDYDTSRVASIKPRLSDVGWGFNVVNSNNFNFGLGTPDDPWTDNFSSGIEKASLHQYKADKFRKLKMVSGVLTDAGMGSKSEGWCSVNQNSGIGCCICLRDIWQKFPKEIEVERTGSGTKINLHFWPANGNLPPSLEESDFSPDDEFAIENIYKLWYAHRGKTLDFNLPQNNTDKLNFINSFDDVFGTYRKYVGQAGFLQEEEVNSLDFYANDRVRGNAQGISIANQFCLKFHAAETSLDDLSLFSKIYQFNPHAQADGQWNVKTETEGKVYPVKPPGETGFPIMEEAFEKSQDFFRKIIDDNDEYGMWIYGNVHDTWFPQISASIKNSSSKEHGGPNLHRIWSGAHYQNMWLIWLLCYRGGSHDMLKWARVNTQFLMDVNFKRYDTIYDDEDSLFFRSGGFYHCHSYLPWGCGIMNTSHWINPDAFLYRYYLTGDLDAKECYEIWIAGIFREGVSLNTGDSPRENVNTFGEIINYYNASFDPQALFLLNYLFEDTSVQEVSNIKGINTSTFLSAISGMRYMIKGTINDNFLNHLNWHQQAIERFYRLTRDKRIIDYAEKWIKHVDAAAYNDPHFIYEFNNHESIIAFLKNNSISFEDDPGFVNYFFHKITSLFFNHIIKFYREPNKYHGYGLSKSIQFSKSLQNIPYLMNAFDQDGIHESTEINADVLLNSFYPCLITVNALEDKFRLNAVVLFVEKNGSFNGLELKITKFAGETDAISHAELQLVRQLPDSPNLWRDGAGNLLPGNQVIIPRDTTRYIAWDQYREHSHDKGVYAINGTIAGTEVYIHAPVNNSGSREAIVLNAFSQFPGDGRKIIPAVYNFFRRSSLYINSVFNIPFVLEFRAHTKDDILLSANFPASIQVISKATDHRIPLLPLNLNAASQWYQVFNYGGIPDGFNKNNRVFFLLNPAEAPFQIKVIAERGCLMTMHAMEGSALNFYNRYGHNAFYRHFSTNSMYNLLTDLPNNFYLYASTDPAAMRATRLIDTITTVMNTMDYVGVISGKDLNKGSSNRYINSRGKMVVLIRFYVLVPDDFNTLEVYYQNNKTEGKLKRVGFQSVEFISDEKLNEIDSTIILSPENILIDGSTGLAQTVDPLKNKVMIRYHGVDNLLNW